MVTGFKREVATMPVNPRKPVNPIWSIERALKHGYVMEPHGISGCFSGPNCMSRPGHECAIMSQAINDDMREPSMKNQTWGLRAKPCETQCDECAHICHMNDYIRAKPHCPPHFPVPATTGNAYIGKYWVYLAHADADANAERGPFKVFASKTVI